MHKGKQWRAARPRKNLPESGYSQRWPHRLSLFGQFDYNGSTVAIPTQTVWGDCQFDAPTITWENTNNFTIGSDSFVGRARVRPLNSAWMWEVVVEVSDGSGHASNTWTFDERTHPPIGPGVNWFFPPPTSHATSGLFGPTVFLKFQPVLYPD